MATESIEKTLQFVQCTYDLEFDFPGGKQTSHLYPFAIHYHNAVLSPYFENDIIARIVPELDSDLIAVCSWRLRQKRGDSWMIKDKQLTIEKILNADFDIAVLTPRDSSHMPLSMAKMWHGQNWTTAFEVFKEFLQRDLHITVPDELNVVIYENHFIAKREIYHEYVENVLIPAMKFMDSNPVFSLDATYINKKPAYEREHIVKRLGRNDYPIGVFILERLFSIWIHGRNYKIINL